MGPSAPETVVDTAHKYRDRYTWHQNTVLFPFLISSINLASFKISAQSIRQTPTELGALENQLAWWTS